MLAAISLAIGVLIGNWVFIPLANKDKSHAESFVIGVIAAVVVLILRGVAYILT